MLSNVIPTLISGGFGAGITAILVATIQNFGKKKESRASAADLITNAAGEIVDRLQKENIRMRKSLLLLTDVLDGIIEDMAVDPELKVKLKQVNRKAKESI